MSKDTKLFHSQNIYRPAFFCKWNIRIVYKTSKGHCIGFEKNQTNTTFFFLYVNYKLKTFLLNCTEMIFVYYTSLSFPLYKNMTVVLLLHPKINCMTIPPCGTFSNHISQIFQNHSSHWSKLNDVIHVLGLFHCAC
jgi:hypothetical protein